MAPAPLDPQFEELLLYIRQSRGLDFSGYKQSTLMRRIQKQMQAANIDHFSEYLDYLEVHPDEFAALLNTILINVTAFFRDSAAWQYLQTEALPLMLARKPVDEPIRVWSAGCASGQEAYTLAIALAEVLGIEEFRQRVKIYATDIDEETLNQARQAVYSEKDVQELPAEIRQKYFEIAGDRFTFRHDLRRSVILGRHDLLQDAPISRLDLLVCRNTLMYFNAEAQARILGRFHFALNETGLLFLGKAEMLLTHSNLFSPMDLKHRIFTKIAAATMRDRFAITTQASKAEVNSRLPRYIRLREVVFDTLPLAQIVVDSSGTVVLINQQARTTFGLSNQDLNQPFHDLEISYRPAELRSLIEQATTERRSVTRTNVERILAGDRLQYFNICVTPLQDNGNGLLGVSIYFEDVSTYVQIQQELRRARQDLETTTEELQSTNEELETTNEELQSTNEELETTNEELQSTNEELETMNEELQSTNEELQTMNHELGDRTIELNRTNTFLRSIIISMQTGIVVINTDFNILIWNDLVEDLWGLRNAEVLGKSLFSLDIGLPIEQLRSPILNTLNRNIRFQEVLLDATNRRGKAIRCQVILTPLSNDQTVEGVVLRMADLETVHS